MQISTRYSAVGGIQILSGILIKATGRPVLEFAEETLFSPLDIHIRQNVVLRSKEEHFAVMNDKNKAASTAFYGGSSTKPNAATRPWATEET